MKDVQGELDRRNIPLKHVGITIVIKIKKGSIR